MTSVEAAAFLSWRLFKCRSCLYCSQRLKFTSSLINAIKGDKALTKKDPNESEKRGLKIFERHNDVPTSLGFPNEKGIENYDPSMPLKDIVSGVPVLFKDEVKKMKNEWANNLRITLDKKEMIEQAGIVEHGETVKEFVFDSPEALSMWNIGCDADEGYGYSKCELVPTDRKTAIFRGYLSTEVDGKHERSGWASMKLNLKKSFFRKLYFTRWSSYSHLLIKCRGDGRSYKVMLHCPGLIDVLWGNSYSFPLHTHGGPYWQYEKIPFSKFFLTVGGRIQDNQTRIYCDEISSVGIVLMDRMDGEFSLELDFIGITHDQSHREQFAYEVYSLPLFNTRGC
uniref:CIA30 domain-containing protein n=1 Tax=Syphacia muris TaxID=451379 RepID=A0A0N5AXW4_9BILA